MTSLRFRHATTDTIVQLFEERGASQYGGEAVSQLEHALQAAWQAERHSASPELIVAALVHDIGHLLHSLGEDIAEQGIDDIHERLGAEWLRDRFQADLVAAVELHVAAKRYLCATDATYQQQLSPASQVSLNLQGGPMNEREVKAFASGPHAQDAIRLRHWDDSAKVVNLKTPGIHHFAQYIEQVLDSAT